MTGVEFPDRVEYLGKRRPMFGIVGRPGRSAEHPCVVNEEAIGGIARADRLEFVEDWTLICLTSTGFKERAPVGVEPIQRRHALMRKLTQVIDGPAESALHVR